MDDRYEWSEGSREFLLEVDGSLYEIESGGDSPQQGVVPTFVAGEMLRLSRENVLLRAALSRTYAVVQGAMADLRAELGKGGGDAT